MQVNVIDEFFARALFAGIEYHPEFRVCAGLRRSTFTCVAAGYTLMTQSEAPSNWSRDPCNGQEMPGVVSFGHERLRNANIWVAVNKIERLRSYAGSTRNEDVQRNQEYHGPRNRMVGRGWLRCILSIKYVECTVSRSKKTYADLEPTYHSCP
jgi:hypothetical protein